MKGTANPSTEFDRVVFPEGVYPMTLKRAFVMWGKPSQYAPDGAPKIGMVWAYKDEDGGEAELMDFLTFPKNLAYNEKSNFWKRLSEIAAVTINKENVADVDMDFGSFIDTYDELVEHIRSNDDTGKPHKAEVKSITVGSQKLLGKECQLVVKIWQNGDKEGNNISSVLQMGASQKPALKRAGTPPKAEARTPQPAAPAPKTDDMSEEMPF